MLSPFIRHGLLTLGEVWHHVSGGPAYDVKKFRDELLWQEFARHWYARLGTATRRGVRRELPIAPTPPASTGDWGSGMACLEAVVDELVDDGWLVNQTRMWLASDWAVRRGHAWQRGEDLFFQHLLDGSRAANRLGWQWTTGVGSSKHYGFSRWQVNNRAPGLCNTCEQREHCPIEDWPSDPAFDDVERPPMVRRDDPERYAGPAAPPTDVSVDAVWLTAESLGVSDPALRAHPDVPAVFTFDRPLLATLQLSAKRLVFLVETLAELHHQGGVDVELWCGDPVEPLQGRRTAVTFAPVPGFARHSARIDIEALHPWPWLVAPSSGSVASFSAWRKSVGSPARKGR